MNKLRFTDELQITVILLVVCLASSLFAQGSLMVDPKRIVFDGAKRQDVVTLYNSSNDTASYAISFMHYKMEQNGVFTDIDSNTRDILFCDNIVRYFPRELTLAPHQAQAVRLQYIKTKDLAPGEYRSHLFFRAIERVKPIEFVPNDTGKTMSLKLKPIYGLAIPVIVRNQTAPAKIMLSNLTISSPDSAGTVMFTADLNRSGDESTFGELILTYSDAITKEKILADVRGIGVYVPLPMRRVGMQCKLPEITSLSSGVLKLEYRTMTGKEKETVLAISELPLQK